MSAHLRRRGRHAAPPQPLVSPTTLGPAVPAAVMGAALSASLAGGTAYAGPALAATPSSRTNFPAVPHVTVNRHPNTPFGLPSAIEGYAALRQQTHCDPTAKPGVVAFEHMVLRTYPDTRSDGIVRACNIGGP